MEADMFFRTVTDMQNRLIPIAGGLLIAFSLLGCSPSEKSAGPPQPVKRAIVILWTICPGTSEPYKFGSPNTNVVIINDPLIHPPADFIGLNSKTGDLDLTSLKVAAHSHDDPSRHVDITYALETPCKGNKQYSFYFLNDPKPIEGKNGDDLQQLKRHHFDDYATSVSIDYRNRTETGYETFAFSINYTVVKTDGGVDTPHKETFDPNIKNTPVD
jgi:hypothetical protein